MRLVIEFPQVVWTSSLHRDSSLYLPNIHKVFPHRINSLVCIKKTMTPQMVAWLGKYKTYKYFIQNRPNISFGPLSLTKISG